MRVDLEDTLADDQTLTATGNSEHVKNLKAAARKFGAGIQLVIAIIVKAIVANDADETYVAQAQVDDATGLPSPTLIGQAVTIPRAAAVGSVHVVYLPQDLAYEQFLALKMTLGGTTPSITFDAFIVPATALQNESYLANRQPIS